MSFLKLGLLGSMLLAVGCASTTTSVSSSEDALGFERTPASVAPELRPYLGKWVATDCDNWKRLYVSPAKEGDNIIELQFYGDDARFEEMRYGSGKMKSPGSNVWVPYEGKIEGRKFSYKVTYTRDRDNWDQTILETTNEGLTYTWKNAGSSKFDDVCKFERGR